MLSSSNSDAEVPLMPAQGAVKSGFAFRTVAIRASRITSVPQRQASSAALQVEYDSASCRTQSFASIPYAALRVDRARDVRISRAAAAATLSLHPTTSTQLRYSMVSSWSA